jgi:hypothetical protein
MSALERGLRRFIESETKRLDYFVLNLHQMPEALRPAIALQVTSHMTALNAVESEIDKLTKDTLKAD